MAERARPQWLSGSGYELRLNRLPSFMDAWKAGALTVAGQWRSYTAFPNILGDSCDEVGGPNDQGSRYVIKLISMTSIFINGRRPASQKRETGGRDTVGGRMVTPG